METIAYFVIFAGIALGLLYSFKLLVIAFSKSPFWGLGCLFFPIIFFIFAAQHWKETKKLCIGSVCSLLLYLFGTILLAM